MKNVKKIFLKYFFLNVQIISGKRNLLTYNEKKHPF